MFNLTDLLDQLGAHFSLVVIACIELLAAALLVARAVRSAAKITAPWAAAARPWAKQGKTVLKCCVP